MDGRVPWSALPEELWMEIFSGFKIAELGIAARVCKQWNRLASDQRLWKARFCAKWSSVKEKSREISWRSEYKRFLHHVPSVRTDECVVGSVTHLSFSKNGEFFVSSSNFDHILFWKTDRLQLLHVVRVKTELQFVGFNDTGNLVLFIRAERKTWRDFLLVYRFDPTESREQTLDLVDSWEPEFADRDFVTDSISWLDSTHYLVAMYAGPRGCLVQACSATRPRSIVMSYCFEDIVCRMLLAAEIPSEGGGNQKILIFACSWQLNAIYIKRVTDNEVSDRPTKPDHCILMEGPVAGIALMTDKRTLAVNCRTNNNPLQANLYELQIRLVDLVTLRNSTPHPLLGHVSDENVPISSPISAGSLIACSSSDRFVYIFDTEHNCCVGRLPRRRGREIGAIAWNPADGEMLLTDLGGEIILWTSRNRAPEKEETDDEESSLHVSFSRI